MKETKGKVAIMYVPDIPKLQPLKMAGGWTIQLNKFTELEPKDMKDLDPISRTYFFSEHLLELKSNENLNVVLELGWFPEGELEGAYKLEIIRVEDWFHPIYSFQTSSKKEVIDELEYLLFHAWRLFGRN